MDKLVRDRTAEQKAKAKRAAVQVDQDAPNPLEPYKKPMKCPGSMAPPGAHAWAHVVTEFDEDCATVKQEIEARARMDDGWKDPHNGGKYKLNGATNGNDIMVDHYTGNAPHFHDKAELVLVDSKDGGCTLYGCSDSQGISAADGSTNYCNIHNLYANEAKDKVEAVNTNLNYKEKMKTSQLGPMDTQTKACNTMKKAVKTSDDWDDDSGSGSGSGYDADTKKVKEEVKKSNPLEPYKAPMECPGSKAPPGAYAWSHVQTEFDESCDTVKKEIEAGARMDDGWKDPHNHGTYKLNSETSGNTIVTDHYTGNAPHFHDKQMIVLVDGSMRKFHRLVAAGILEEHVEFTKAGGCTLYGCSDSQGISAADGSTNYCNVHNLYANEKQDGVKPVHTDLNYHENMKTSQLGALDTDKRACNTKKKQSALLQRINRLVNHGPDAAVE